MDSDNDKIVISGFDIFDTVKFIDRKSKKHLATLLAELEVIIEDEELYAQVRKIILDSVNNLVRSIVRLIFGDIY